MSTIIDKQVKAFSEAVGDAVIDAHKEAMDYWSVQELTSSACAITDLMVQSANSRRDQWAANPALRDHLLSVCQDHLATLTQARGLIDRVSSRGFDVDGVDNFLDALLNTRELLAILSDPSTQGATQPSPTHAELADAAKLHAPPQSWFEEDTTELRRPTNK